MYDDISNPLMFIPGILRCDWVQHSFHYFQFLRLESSPKLHRLRADQQPVLEKQNLLPQLKHRAKLERTDVNSHVYIYTLIQQSVGGCSL